MKKVLGAFVFFNCLLFLFFPSKILAQVMAWGLNSNGQLGNGNTISPQPLPLNIGQSQVTGLNGGLNHTVALQGDGTLLAWGNNNLGKLGNNSTIDSSSPVTVQNLTGVMAVGVGENHSLALKSDGTVWGWGSNGFGQLGNGTTDFNPHPLPVQVSGLNNIIAISAHLNHNLVLKSDGTVWAWGSNDFGQIGNNSSGGNVSTPNQVMNLSNVIAISAGFQHNAALKSDGTVWVWGRNAEGEVGNNTTTTSGCQCEPLPLQTTITGVSQITAGFFNTAAVKLNGDVFVWGANSFGQIGNGTTGGNVLLPAQSAISNVIELKMRGFHLLARLNDGSVKAWGYNGDGQVGDGTITSTGCSCQPLPVTTSVGAGNSLIDGGYFHGFSAKPQIPTAIGTNQTLFGHNVTFNFANVTGSGTTNYVAINPTTTGLIVPPGYTIQANQPAYNITTTSTTTGNIDVCLTVPNEFGQPQFALLKILHGEGGALVDRTFSSTYIQRQICARVTSLSPFVIAKVSGTTAAGVRVSGRVFRQSGRGISNAVITFTDADGNLRRKRTNSFGYFNFEDVETGHTYVFMATAKGYTFLPQIVTLNDELTDLNFMALDGK
jgi:hypothetical protein